jgi:hypothetical protein
LPVPLGAADEDVRGAPDDEVDPRAELPGLGGLADEAEAVGPAERVRGLGPPVGRVEEQRGAGDAAQQRDAAELHELTGDDARALDLDAVDEQGTAADVVQLEVVGRGTHMELLARQPRGTQRRGGVIGPRALLHPREREAAGEPGRARTSLAARRGAAATLRPGSSTDHSRASPSRGGGATRPCSDSPGSSVTLDVMGRADDNRKRRGCAGSPKRVRPSDGSQPVRTVI